MMVTPLTSRNTVSTRYPRHRPRNTSRAMTPPTTSAHGTRADPARRRTAPISSTTPMGRMMP
ncbi:hypothetical protein A5N15_04210 [Rothia kristinae]|uniref:Uncharacterized protein n=1 Tax=Rothia kristinae TaxID=37923 RepID=A0A657IVC1_9MICC|nr:hypothetical protein A5N15_04210 [Rothia kristinae]